MTNRIADTKLLETKFQQTRLQEHQYAQSDSLSLLVCWGMVCSDKSPTKRKHLKVLFSQNNSKVLLLTNKWRLVVDCPPTYICIMYILGYSVMHFRIQPAYQPTYKTLETFKKLAGNVFIFGKCFHSVFHGACMQQ